MSMNGMSMSAMAGMAANAGRPWVHLRWSGLAQGAGASICEHRAHARRAAMSLGGRVFPKYGSYVLISIVAGVRIGRRGRGGPKSLGGRTAMTQFSAPVGAPYWLVAGDHGGRSTTLVPTHDHKEGS